MTIMSRKIQVLTYRLLHFTTTQESSDLPRRAGGLNTSYLPEVPR